MAATNSSIQMQAKHTGRCMFIPNNWEEYQITLPDNKVYHFDLVPVQLNALKSSGVFPHQFIEDLTEKYKPEYPHVETVYTSQVIK